MQNPCCMSKNMYYAYFRVLGQWCYCCMEEQIVSGGHCSLAWVTSWYARSQRCFRSPRVVFNGALVQSACSGSPWSVMRHHAPLWMMHRFLGLRLWHCVQCLFLCWILSTHACIYGFWRGLIVICIPNKMFVKLKPIYSLCIIRDPISRILEAYFLNCEVCVYLVPIKHFTGTCLDCVSQSNQN